MSFAIAPAGQLELIEAAVWYDDIRLGLGTEFLDAVGGSSSARRADGGMSGRFQWPKNLSINPFLDET